MADAPTLDDVGGRFASEGESIALGPRGALSITLSWGGAQQSEAPQKGRSTAVDTLDLDLAALCFDANGNAIEAVYFNRERSLDGGVVLRTGDQSQGTIGEEIVVRLDAVSPATQLIAFTVVCSSTGRRLADVTDLVLVANGTPQEQLPNCEQVAFTPRLLPGTGGPQVLFPCILDRRDAKGGSWTLKFQSDHLPGETFVDAVPAIRRAVLFPPDSKTAFKIPVHLEKGDKMAVSAADGPTHVGCGWDVVNDEEADVDLSCLLAGGSGEVMDFVYWGKLAAFNGIVQHLGDNLTGEGDGDDEVIMLNLADLPLDVYAAVFVVSNYSEGNLEKLRNIHFRVVRDLDGAELLRFDSIGAGGTYSSFIACSIERVTPRGATWQLRALSVPCCGTTVLDPNVKEALGRIIGPAHAHPTLKPVNLRRAMRAAATTPDSATATLTHRVTGSSKAAPEALRTGSAGRAASTQVAGSQVVLFIIAVIAAYAFSSLF